MSNEIELTTAVTALREHFGTELRAGRDEGRDMMADALVERLHIDRSNAKNLVDLLEKAHTIRWLDDGTVQDVTVVAPTTGQAMPLGVPDAYWQL